MLYSTRFFRANSAMIATTSSWKFSVFSLLIAARRYRHISLITPALLLAACGGGDNTSSSGNSGTGLGTPIAIASQLRLFAGDATSPGNFDGPASSARFGNIGALVVDAQGNVFVGDNQFGTVRKISSSGQVSTIAGNSSGYSETGIRNGICIDGLGAVASLEIFAAMAIDGTGNLYVVDYSCGSMRKISASGLVTSIAGGIPGSVYTFNGPSGSFQSPRGIAFDRSTGNVYVTDYGSNELPWGPFPGSTVLQILPNSTVNFFAGQSGQYGYVDAAGTAARFNQPTDIVADGNGNLFVNDCKNGAIRKIDKAQNVSTFVAPSTGLVHCPSRLTLDAGGNVVVVDATNGIERFSPTGQLISLAKSPSLKNPWNLDLSGMPIAFDSANNMLFGNVTSVKMLSPSGAISTVAGADIVNGSSDGAGGNAQFSQPQGLASDAAGNIYVADTNNFTIRKITSAGLVTTLAGAAGQSGNADGVGTAARFVSPQWTVADAAGNVYVVDGSNGQNGINSNRTIRKITPAGVVTTLLSAGTTRLFNWIAVDSAGTVYVAGNDTISKLSASGQLTPYRSVGFPFYAFAVDTLGNIFATDPDSNVVRKISTLGDVSVLAGTEGAYGTSDGVGAAARLFTPKAIVIDATGNLFVSDTVNHTIRRITPQGAVSTYLGVPGTVNFSFGTAYETPNKVGNLLGPAPGNLHQVSGMAIHGSTLYLTSYNAVLSTGP